MTGTVECLARVCLNHNGAQSRFSKQVLGVDSGNGGDCTHLDFGMVANASKDSVDHRADNPAGVVQALVDAELNVSGTQEHRVSACEQGMVSPMALGTERGECPDLPRSEMAVSLETRVRVLRFENMSATVLSINVLAFAASELAASPRSNFAPSMRPTSGIAMLL